MRFPKMLPVIIVILGLVSQVADTMAASYFALPNGSGTSCTIDTPCTLNSGLAKIAAGDTLFLRGGTYSQSLSFSKSGTFASRITISGYPGEAAVIDGHNSIPSGCYDFLVTINGSYVTFRDIRVQNSFGSGIAAGATTGVQFINVVLDYTGETGLVLGGANNLADHVTVTRNGQRYGSGCSTWGSALCTTGSQNTIQNSVAYNNRGEGLNAYSSSQNSIIQDNVSYNNQSVNLYLDSSTGAIVRRNLVYYSPGWNLSSARCLTIGAETGQASNLTIVNNFLMGGFVNIETDSNLHQLTNVTIANNTIVNARGDLTTGYNMGVYFRPNLTSYVNSVFKDNIVIEESPSHIPISVPASHPGLTFSNNNWNKAPAAPAQGAGDVIGDPRLAKASPTGAGQLTGDYFMILRDSPARDKGTANSSVADDFFKSKRPIGTQADIGGHEYGENVVGGLSPPNNLRTLK